MSQQLIYLALTGLNATMERVAATTNNLANANTTAFKAQRPVFAAEPLYGQGLPDRVDVSAQQDTADLRPGTIEHTGRDLDVAVKGQGWIAVQAADGSVALTRNGSLMLSAAGTLQTSDGHPVLGRGGAPIVLPPLQKVTVGEDGTISGSLVGQPADQVVALNRILLADPPVKSLSRRPDGLFQDTAGTPTPDAKVTLQSGSLETSNTDSVGLMLSLIEDTRMYQMQTQLVHTMLGIGQNQGTVLSLT